MIVKLNTKMHNNFFIYESDKLSYILPEYNKQYYLQNGLFEKDLIDWCKQFCSPDKNFLDIGAHTGTYSITLSPYCSSVYSFEPQRAIYNALCGSLALSGIKNVFTNNIALGSSTQSGKALLYVEPNDGGGSTLMIDHASNFSYKTEITKVATLDSYNLNNIGFIKIDAEGNEYNIISGAQETLQRSSFPTILFENNTNNNDVNTLLYILGYKIHEVNGYPNMFLATKN